MGDRYRSEAEPAPSQSDDPAYQSSDSVEPNSADPQWKVELSAGSSRRRRPIGPVSTFGGASRFSSGKGPLTRKTSAPDGDHFYGRNEVYDRYSCLNGRKKFGRIGKAKREFGEKPTDDGYVGPGSHVVTGAVLSQTGRASPLDGKEFCAFTLKSKAGFKSRPTQSCDVMYKLPGTLGAGGAKQSKGERKFDLARAGAVDLMYDPPEPKFGGTKEFLRTTFNNDRRFRGLFAGPGDIDDRDIYYGKVVLGKDDWMSRSRASSFGARLRPPKSQWGPHLAPGAYETNTDDPALTRTFNVHFRDSMEWQKSLMEPTDSFGSFRTSQRSPYGSSLRWSNKDISVSQRSLP